MLQSLTNANAFILCIVLCSRHANFTILKQKKIKTVNGCSLDTVIIYDGVRLMNHVIKNTFEYETKRVNDLAVHSTYNFHRN